MRPGTKAIRRALQISQDDVAARCGHAEEGCLEKLIDLLESATGRLKRDRAGGDQLECTNESGSHVQFLVNHGYDPLGACREVRRNSTPASNEPLPRSCDASEPGFIRRRFRIGSVGRAVRASMEARITSGNRVQHRIGEASIPEAPNPTAPTWTSHQTTKYTKNTKGMGRKETLPVER